MMNHDLDLAISPCPNDTFAFSGLVLGHVPTPGFQLGTVVYEDIETLNQLAHDQQCDIIKLSFHALGFLQNRYQLLSTGCALGRGCGPLLVRQTGYAKQKPLPHCTIAIPGALTTASFLLKLYCSDAKTVPMRFDHIMPAVAKGEVDAGVIIHESRFTFHQYGLEQVVDLGSWWEEETQSPLPLGGIVLSKRYDATTVKNVTAALRESILWARKHPELCWPYVKKYAQELDKQVIDNHIDLYVNNFTEDLGDEGRRAVEVFFEKGKNNGIF